MYDVEMSSTDRYVDIRLQYMNESTYHIQFTPPYIIFLLQVFDYE